MIKRFLFKLLLPNFIFEISEEINKQPNRCTSHPFWQVRCKRFVPTYDGYDEHHKVLVDDGGEFWRSDKCEESHIFDYLEDYYSEWVEDNGGIDQIKIGFDIEWFEFPENIVCLPVREVEEVVSTHLTQSDADWFIERKQHDYPPLYTWVESAYWSPQIKQLQDWLKCLTN